MLKILIAIKCCHTRQEFAEASRQTWVRNIHGMNYRIFYGHGQHELKPDEVQLDVPDGYDDLASKIYEIFSWALKHEYDYVLQVDDDTYVRPEKLLQSNFQQYDFVAGSSFGVDECNRLFQYVAGQSSTGPGFWLSKKAMNVVVNSLPPSHGQADEPWIGKVLNHHGIRVYRTTSMGCYGNLPHSGIKELCLNCWLPETEDIIAEWEYNPEQMIAVHKQWETGTRTLP
jgi:hypothetical protein